MFLTTTSRGCPCFSYREQSAAGVGVFTVDGKMIDVAFIPGAERTLKLARACGMYEGDLV